MTEIGDRAPDFALPDTDGAERALETPAVVIFTCNHCPYALAWHDRLADAARDYPNVHFYAINPNDAERYPRDSFDAMRERVERDGGWPMPYLRDETQDVARAYRAKTTPDVFVIDAAGVLRYRGAPDPDHEDPSLGAGWLREALDSVLAGEDVARPETDSIGCSVKWK
jgi:AhpC/TSA family protein